MLKLSHFATVGNVGNVRSPDKAPAILRKRVTATGSAEPTRSRQLATLRKLRINARPEPGAQIAVGLMARQIVSQLLMYG
jgi:hypothetical protein